MTQSLKVTTAKGYEAELTIVNTIDGSYVARAAAFWRGIRTPAIDLMAFDSEGEATHYIVRLEAALLNKGA
jgi:hypothetical protein